MFQNRTGRFPIEEKRTWLAISMANLSSFEPASEIFFAALMTSMVFFRGPRPLMSETHRVKLPPRGRYWTLRKFCTENIVFFEIRKTIFSKFLIVFKNLKNWKFRRSMERIALENLFSWGYAVLAIFWSGFLSHLVKSVISIMMTHICLARTIISLPVSSHFTNSRSNLAFSSRKKFTWNQMIVDNFCRSPSQNESGRNGINFYRTLITSLIQTRFFQREVKVYQRGSFPMW